MQKLEIEMQPEEIKIHVGVSEYLFRLATESVRLYSNSVWSLATLDEVINSRGSRVVTIVPDYGPEAVREHFRIIPTGGSRSLFITILDTNVASFEAAAELLTDALGRGAAVIDAVSISLYDLIVEQEVAQISAKLGLSGEAAAAYRELIRCRGTNVVPIR